MILENHILRVCLKLSSSKTFLSCLYFLHALTDKQFRDRTDNASHYNIRHFELSILHTSRYFYSKIEGFGDSTLRMNIFVWFKLDSLKIESRIHSRSKKRIVNISKNLSRELIYLGKSKINSISVRNIDDIPNRLLDGFISKMGVKESEGASQRKNRRVVVFHADRLWSGTKGGPFSRQGQFNKVDEVWIFLISRQSWTAGGAWSSCWNDRRGS